MLSGIFFFKNKKRVNLVIKDHVIRFLDSKQPDLSSVRSCAERYLPEGVIRQGKIMDKVNLLMILEECVQEWGIKNREVQFLVPDPYVVVRKLQIPSDLKDDEIKGYFYLELGSSIHLPFEDPVFDFVILEEKNEQKEILFFAAPENIVLDYSSTLEQVKLKPIAADISPLAIFRLYYHLGRVRPEDHLLGIQFDIQTVNLSIFKESNILFMRQLRMDIDLGGWKKTLNEAGHETLVWGGNEEYLSGEIRNVISEIERVMNFYRFSINQGKETITRILLTGEHPNLGNIESLMSETFDIPIENFNEEQFTTMKGDVIMPQHLLSLGLSLKEV